MNSSEKTMKLSSLKAPRDLSLGGCAAPSIRSKSSASKKVYLPNLNVVRQKATDVKTSKDTTKKFRNKFDKLKSERGARGAGNLIQTLGVFSEGVGASFKKSSSVFTSSSSSSSSKKTEERPRRSIQLNGKFDAKAEQKVIDDILGAESDGSADNCDPSDYDYNPVKLLKDDSRKLESLHKLESLKLNDLENNKISDIEELFNCRDSELFLFQFPDALPFERTDEKSEKNTEETDDNISKKSSISNLPEGQIGKLIKYKSGKHKLMLGSTIFDLDVGMESRFLQQLVSIVTRQEERSGDMINLGEIKTKLTATPDWKMLSDN